VRGTRTWGPLALLCAACAQSGSSPPQACTLIGCESGLEVQVEPPPSGDFRVEVEAADGASRAFQCPQGTTCGGRAFFPDFMPAAAAIRVIVDGDTTSASVMPEYRTTQPNGAACPPTCRFGTATVRTAADNADDR
jgi:hypothetical protein